MADAQHTSLLDEYLQKTAACLVANPHRERQQLKLDSGDDAIPHPSQAPIIAGNMMLRDVHQALDDVLAAATGSPATAAGRPASAVATQPFLSTAQAAAHQQHPQHQRGLTSSQAPGSTANSTLGKQRGIFRAMRQADAAALYSERFKRDQEDRGQKQQPVLVAPYDGANAAVRVIASNAALQAKLAKLQADLEARSHRQELLQQLQQPSALFQQQQQQQQLYNRQYHHHGLRNSMDAFAADASIHLMDTAVCKGLLGQSGTLRPATSPALMGGSGSSRHPTAYSSAATAASSRRNSTLEDDAGVQSWRAKGTGSLPGTPGKLAAQQQQQQRRRLSHLQELAEYQLPWKPAAPAAAGKAGSSNMYNQHATASRQARPRTSAGGAAQPGAHSAIGGSSSSNRLQGLAATPRGHSTLAGSRATSHHIHHQQQQEHSQQQHVQRPMSALAALQQSLGELVTFKSRVQQHQHEQKQHAHVQQQTALQQQHQQHTRQHRDPGFSCVADSSGLPHQRSYSSTWLPETSLQHLHEALVCPGQHMGPAAAAAAAAAAPPAAGQCGLLQGRAASAGGGWMDGHPSRQRAGASSGRHSSTAGYGLWDSWQEHVHAHAAAGAAAHAGHGHLSCTYGRSGWQRAQSAPRPLRAWDVLPLPSAAAAAASVRARRRSCYVSSPGRLPGHVQQLRQQGHLLQEQRRPLTAAGALGGLAHTAGAGSSVKPLGLHNSHAAYAAAGGAAAAVAAGSGAVGSNASSSSAWLVSSPLQRAQQCVATGGRSRSSGGGGGSAAAAGSLTCALGRGRTAAAVLSGVQAPGAAHQVIISTGGSPSSADDRRLAGLGTGNSAPCSSAAAQPGSGKAASVTAQLLQQVRAQQALGGDARVSSGASYADKVESAASRIRSSGRGSSSAVGSALLTAQILEYAAGLYKPAQAKPRPSDSCSTTSSGSSSGSDSSELVPAARDKQAAYASALARVHAAKHANRRDDSDDRSS